MIIADDVSITAREFAIGTGWQLRPEGACLGEICIPVHDAPASDDERVDVVAIAERMGMPIVRDDDHAITAIGPWPGSGRALATAAAPELVLPDLDGNEFRLSSLRGQKVLLIAWAPY